MCVVPVLLLVCLVRVLFLVVYCSRFLYTHTLYSGNVLSSAACPGTRISLTSTRLSRGGRASVCGEATHDAETKAGLSHAAWTKPGH